MRDYDAHSPMFKNPHFNDERRSKLFSDKPWIYGRLPKYVLGFMACMQFWSGYYVYHKNALNQHLQDQTRKAYRRTLPFVQAMEDVRFVAVQERNYMILRAVCDYSSPDMFNLMRARWNQEDTFVSYYRGTTMRNHYDGRFSSSRFWSVKSNRKP